MVAWWRLLVSCTMWQHPKAAATKALCASHHPGAPGEVKPRPEGRFLLGLIYRKNKHLKLENVWIYCFFGKLQTSGWFSVCVSTFGSWPSRRVANPEAFFVFKLDSSETETSVKASTKSHGCPWIMGYRHLWTCQFYPILVYTTFWGIAICRTCGRVP